MQDGKEGATAACPHNWDKVYWRSWAELVGQNNRVIVVAQEVLK